MKQAPRTWSETLKHSFLSFQFTSSRADNSLFIKHAKGHFMFVLVHVDDVIITGTSSIEVEKVIAQLSSAFPLKDLGNLSFFLGLEATRSDKGLLLTQKKYVSNLLSKVSMENCK